MTRTFSALTALALGVGFIGCVVHQGPPPSAQPAPTAAPAPTPTGTIEPAPAPVTNDPTAEIPADPEDPASVTDALPPQPPMEAPPTTPGAAEELAAGVADGKPAGIEPGSPAAFWIWRNPAGVWKVRTTTAKLPHLFRGRVKGVRSPIGTVRPSRTEFADRVAKAGQEVHFNFATKGHVDGFDFRVQGCVRFDLQIDGGPAPKKIFVGQGVASPKTNHFILCPAQ